MERIKPERIVPEAEVVEKGLTKLDPATVILHVYGPSGGFYAAMESDKLAILMESAPFTNILKDLDPSERLEIAAMAVRNISRRTAAANSDHAASTMLALLANLAGTMGKAALQEIRALLVFDGRDKFHVATYKLEDQEEFDRHWRELYRTAYPSGSVH